MHRIVFTLALVNYWRDCLTGRNGWTHLLSARSPNTSATPRYYFLTAAWANSSRGFGFRLFLLLFEASAPSPHQAEHSKQRGLLLFQSGPKQPNHEGEGLELWWRFIKQEVTGVNPALPAESHIRSADPGRGPGRGGGLSELELPASLVYSPLLYSPFALTGENWSPFLTRERSNKGRECFLR